MGETRSCFTSHTSLTRRRGTHLTTDTTQDRTKREEGVRSSQVSDSCLKRDLFKCLLFILLETENVGGGWWASGGA